MRGAIHLDRGGFRISVRPNIARSQFRDFRYPFPTGPYPLSGHCEAPRR